MGVFSIYYYFKAVAGWVILFVFSGFLFSSDITSAMDRYGNELAECIIEKAKRMCKDLQDVGAVIYNFFFVVVVFCFLIEGRFVILGTLLRYRFYDLTILPSVHQVKVETRIESGDPRDVICQMAEKLGADVLVMGSHGYGLIKRWDPLGFIFTSSTTPKSFYLSFAA